MCAAAAIAFGGWGHQCGSKEAHRLAIEEPRGEPESSFWKSCRNLHEVLRRGVPVDVYGLDDLLYRVAHQWIGDVASETHQMGAVGTSPTQFSPRSSPTVTNASRRVTYSRMWRTRALPA
jgi:hypothetical protein